MYIYIPPSRVAFFYPKLKAAPAFEVQIELLFFFRSQGERGGGCVLVWLLCLI